ncbi:hypothetical protein TNCV_4289951 [Trichonephila clavipes]|nr:hypothetical protein TNCV_4289951 [Trichonephila clavipes]
MPPKISKICFCCLKYLLLRLSLANDYEQVGSVLGEPTPLATNRKKRQAKTRWRQAKPTMAAREYSWIRTATAGSNVVNSGRPIFDDFFQYLWPYIGNNTANDVFQMVKRLWLIRMDQ